MLRSRLDLAKPFRHVASAPATGMRIEREQEVDIEITAASDGTYTYPDRAGPLPTLPARPAIEFDDSTEAYLDSIPALPTISATPASDADESLCGSLIDDRYFIERKLGQGGMGAVYLSRDRRLMNKQVVVKILLREFLGNDWSTRKFLQEKEALARANHPGIVGITDAGELATGEPYMVMEFIDGVTLQSAIPPTGMDFKRAGHLIRQIGSALSAAHDKGILHRDLKPANVMLQLLHGSDEQIRIIDFGIAQVRDSEVADHTVAGRFGTHVYMSPEQFRVEQITAASDVYSMGAISYQMVTGHLPFDPKAFKNIGEMYTAGLQVPPRDLRRDLPLAAQKAILKALSALPQDRFQKAAEFGEALAQALSEPATIGARRVALRELTERRRESPPQLKGLAKSLRGRGQFLKLSAPVFIVAFIAVAVVMVAGLVATALLPSSKPQQNRATFESRAPSIASVPEVPPASSLTYWLSVQKGRSGQRFESVGTETFENGDAFSLNVEIAKSGFLYVLNKGSDKNGAVTFTIIYPLGESSAQVMSEQTIPSARNRFLGSAGTEQFWIVWSANPIEQLDRAAKMANKNGGRIDKSLTGALSEFLEGHANAKSKTPAEMSHRRTLVSNDANLLVSSLELKHQ